MYSDFIVSLDQALSEFEFRDVKLRRKNSGGAIMGVRRVDFLSATLAALGRMSQEDVIAAIPWEATT